MLFAATELAARIERADARLMHDSAQAAGRRRPAAGAFATPLAGGYATFTAPGSPLNYLARRDGAVAGGASMRLFEGIAQHCGAATLPEHRRRGVQSALLGARLEAARQACLTRRCGGHPAPRPPARQCATGSSS